MIVVTEVAVFGVVGSKVLLVTVAVLLACPKIPVTLIVTDAVAPFANVPRLQIRVPPAVPTTGCVGQLPRLGTAAANCTSTGSTSVMVTFCAAFGPLLVTVTV